MTELSSVLHVHFPRVIVKYKISIVLILTLICIFDLHSQTVQNISGLPVLLFSDGYPSTIRDTDLKNIDSLGVDAALVEDVNNDFLARVIQNNLPINLRNNLMIIPDQIWDDSSYIKRYTDAHYTIWEAEGTPLGHGTVNWESVPSLTDYFCDINSGVSGIKTKPNAGAGIIMQGPGYYQDGKFRSLGDSAITYTADFRLKIERINENNPNDLTNAQTVICTLKVQTRQVTNASQFWDSCTVGTYPIEPVFTKILYVGDFIPGEWTIMDTIKYDWKKGGMPDKCIDKMWVQGGNQVCGNNQSYMGQFVEFVIEWEGSPYYSLYVDKVTVFDNRGFELKKINSEIPGKIKYEATKFSNQDAIYSWYGLDEPYTIDNYEPYRIVDSLIGAATAATGNTKRLNTSYEVRSNGRYGLSQDGSFKYYTAEDFSQRANPEFIWLNAYFYHYPYDTAWTLSNYKADNLKVLTNKLTSLKRANCGFGFNLQCCDYYLYDDTAKKWNKFLWAPSNEMMLYNANINLLYGAKKVGLYEYFSHYDTTTHFTYVNGLVDTGHIPNSRYYYLRDHLIPRFKGLFGQTLKKLTQTEEYPDFKFNPVNYLTGFQIGNYPLNTLPSGEFGLDLGFFTEGNKKYFMLLNRWYNSFNYPIKMDIDHNQFGNYHNLKVTEYITDSTYTIIPGEKLTFYAETGDARLYGIVPVVKYGGNLIADETISGTNTLDDTITIESGATLTISGTYNANANIIIKPGGNLIVAPGGHLNFANGCSLIYNCPQINLTAIIQGFYNGSKMVSDTVTVELHNSSTPYALVESNKGVLDTTGYGTFFFTTADNNTPYYIVVKHRNSIETWSASALSFSSDTLSYDFTTDSTRAFGNNLVKVGTKWCLFSGDVNQDGYITGDDYTGLDNDNNNFTYHIENDINGDGYITGNDYTCIDNNILAFVSKVVPDGASIKRIKHQLKLVGKK